MGAAFGDTSKFFPPYYLLQYVSGEITCAVIEIMNIEDVIIECSAEEKREVKIAMAEIMGCVERVNFRHTVAYDASVFLGSLRGTDYVTVLVIDKPFAA